MSADLFAAFEDPSQPPPQQTASNASSGQPAFTSFPLASSPGSLVETPHRQWSHPSSSPSNPPQLSWDITRPSLPLDTRPAPAPTGVVAGTQPINIEDAEDDDGWGDFEVAPDTILSPPPPREAPRTPNPANTKQPVPVANTSERPTRIVRASTLDLVSNSLVDLQEPSLGSNQSRKPFASPAKLGRKPPEPHERTKRGVDPNVLFDADDFEEGQGGEGSDDDFGEFETVPATAQPQIDLLSGAQFAPSSGTNTAKKASELLLDLDPNNHMPKPVQTAQTNVAQARSTARKQEPSRPDTRAEAAKSRLHTTSQTLGDDWDSLSDLPRQPVKSRAPEATWDWDSVEPPKTIEPTKHIPTQLIDRNTGSDDDASWDWDPVDTKTAPAVEVEDSALPPINIPPPSILLSAFPQLFDQANEYLYKPINGQPQNIKDRILSDTKVYDYLSGYLSLAAVAARIIAGRRMRWHRDKFLSQSMSISAAGSKGMKLAGLDKTRTVREDREAADIVSSWKSQVGRLRSAVASANSVKATGGKQLKIPEITDTMQVLTAKDVPTAPRACVICGLKRNERVAKVDHEVEDSFGEWWVEHWGHVACKRFWLQHENTLRQR